MYKYMLPKMLLEGKDSYEKGGLNEEEGSNIDTWLWKNVEDSDYGKSDGESS